MPSFLENGDIPADCLSDLRTKENKLSVWYIDDDSSNLPRVLTALAANCDDLSNIDYLLFDHQIVAELGLEVSKTSGGTPDKEANSAWHRDLEDLSGRKVLNFATAIFYGSTLGRKPENVVSEWLKAGIDNNYLDRSKLKPKLAARVQSGVP